MKKWEQDNLKKLQMAIDNIELTKTEEKTLNWLAGWDNITVENICSIFKKIQQQPDKPACFKPESENPYPLCVGHDTDECKKCCLWVNFGPDFAE